MLNVLAGSASRCQKISFLGSASRRPKSSFFAPSLAAIAVVALAACSSDDDGDGGRGQPTRRGGRVTLTSMPAPENTFSADASFWGFYGTPVPDPCQRQTFGACEVAECPPMGALNGEYATGAYQAGRITVENTQQPVILEAGASHATGAGELFRGGEQLTVRAEAGEVPAFEGTVLAPSALTFSEPAVTAGATPDDSAFVLSPTRDATFRWTGGVAGTTLYVFASHNNPDPNTRGPSAVCTFDAGTGTGVMPAAVLEQLARSASDLSFFFEVAGRQQIEVGDVSIIIEAMAPVHDAQGAWFYGRPVRFE
jgi:hypothetical protein